MIPPSFFEGIKEVLPRVSINEPNGEAVTQSLNTSDINTQEIDEVVAPIQVLETLDNKKTNQEIKTHPVPERTKRVSALSIKSIQKQQQLKKELIAKQPDQQDLPKEEFTEEAFLKAWLAYTKKIEKQGKYNLYSHLTMSEPQLKGNLIQLVFPNSTIKVEVERAKYELLGYIREELKNYDIDLGIEVNETEQKKYAYTPREKYDKLKEKNPLLDQLRKEFDLDI